jgi:predicted MPP superfamily phosphohydrolase
LRLAWVTDVHLNFVPSRKRFVFYDRIRDAQPGALLLGGDIGEADTVTRLLKEMAAALRLPIYFVLGNHDFYRGSIAEIREVVEREASASQWLHWLPASGVVELTAATALIGHDSWADGRCGDFFRSEVMLNDYILIHELRGLTKKALYAKLNALGDEAAEFLGERAGEALAARRNAIVLTHVPPFREASWHEGRISDDDWLPHFACRAAGDRLAAVMRRRPDCGMTVLCGHTHGSGVAHILPNLAVSTGGAVYGEPAIQDVWEVE